MAKYNGPPGFFGGPGGFGGPPGGGNMLGGILGGIIGGAIADALEDEFGNNSNHSDEEPPQRRVKLPTECPTCGAPVTAEICEYCGSNVVE